MTSLFLLDDDVDDDGVMKGSCRYNVSQSFERKPQKSKRTG